MVHTPVIAEKGSQEMDDLAMTSMSVQMGQTNAAWMRVASTHKVPTDVNALMAITVMESTATITTSAVRTLAT